MYTFQSLPIDVVRLMALKLDALDLGHFFRVCKRHANISNDDKFWRKKLKLDFSLFHGNLESPFINPATMDLTEEKRAKYKNRIKNILLRFPSKDEKRREYILKKFDSFNLFKCFRVTLSYIDPNYKTISLDSYYAPDQRQKYLRLYIERCKARGKRVSTRDVKKDPEYIQIQERLKALQKIYRDKGKLLKKTAKTIQAHLAPKFEPVYHELILPIDIIDDIIDYGRYDAIKECIEYTEFTHGTLIALRAKNDDSLVEESPIVTLIFIHVEKNGQFEADLRRDVNVCPYTLNRIAIKNGWSEEKVKEIYQLPFTLRFNASDYESDSSCSSYDCDSNSGCDNGCYDSDSDSSSDSSDRCNCPGCKDD